MPEGAGGAPLAGAWDLLRPKVQMARHRARHRERGTLRRVAVGVLLGGAFWFAAFRVALRLLRYFRSAEDIGTLLAVKLLSMILLSFGSILLLSNTVAALSNFFLARDLDQLAAAPVRAGALYRARLAETLLHSSWMVGLLLVPLVAAYGVAYAGGWWFGAVAVLVLFPFLLLPAALGSAVTLGLVNVFPARRTRDLLSVISALAVAGLALLFRAARPEQLARPEGFRNFMDFVASLDAPSSPWLPSEWVSEALLGFLSGAPAWGMVARLWGVALGLAALGQWLHGRGWARAFSLAQEGGHRAQQAAGERHGGARWLAWLGPLRRELVLKELRVFARDSTQWSQLVLVGVLLVVYVANVRYLPLSGDGMTTLLRNLIPFLNLALAGFVLASIAARFVFPGVSLEGRALWLLRSSPLPMRELVWAKFWVGVVPLLVLALVLVGATNLLLGVRPFVHWVSLAAITGLVFPLAGLALGFGAAYPRFDTENAAQIPTSYGGLLYMLSAIALIGTVAFLTGRPAARFVLSSHFGWGVAPTEMLLPFGAALAACVLATVVPLRVAQRRLEALERG